MPRKPKTTPHLRIRLDAELLVRLEKSRQANHRTLTGEIAHRLEQSFRREDTEEVISTTARQTAEAAANAVAEHFVMRIGGKPVAFKVDYTEDPDGALRGWRVPTGDEAKRLLRRPHMELGRGSSTPKPDPAILKNILELKDILDETERLLKRKADPELVAPLKKKLAAHERILREILDTTPAKATEDK
jgi:hypothetical protein